MTGIHNKDEELTVYAIVSCLGLLFIYLVYNYSQVFLYHNSNIHLQKTFENSMFWLKRYKDNGDAASGTMAVQTLRNTILVAVFIGGSSFSSGFTILEGITSHNSTPEVMKAIILSSLFFLSFIAWAGVCRIASQLGYVVGTIPTHYKNHLEHDRSLISQMNEDNDNENKIMRDSFEIDSDNEFKELLEAETMIKNLVFFFSLGFRFLFVAIPFAFITISTFALIAVTVLIIILFYFMDHSTSKITPKFRKMKNSL